MDCCGLELPIMGQKTARNRSRDLCHLVLCSANETKEGVASSIIMKSSTYFGSDSREGMENGLRLLLQYSRIPAQGPTFLNVTSMKAVPIKWSLARIPNTFCFEYHVLLPAKHCLTPCREVAVQQGQWDSVRVLRAPIGPAKIKPRTL